MIDRLSLERFILTLQKYVSLIQTACTKSNYPVVCIIYYSILYDSVFSDHIFFFNYWKSKRTFVSIII